MSDEAGPRPSYYTDKRTGFRFDPQVGAYALEGSSGYEKPALGYSVRYRGPGSEHIDIYLYDLDRPDIPEGVEGDVIMQGFSEAVGALAGNESAGGIVDFQLRETECISLLRPGGPEFLHAAATYAVTPREDVTFTGPQTSHMLFRGFRGKFLKVRFSYPTEDTPAARSRFEVFVNWLGAQCETRH